MLLRVIEMNDRETIVGILTYSLHKRKTKLGLKGLRILLTRANGLIKTCDKYFDFKGETPDAVVSKFVDNSHSKK